MQIKTKRSNSFRRQQASRGPGQSDSSLHPSALEFISTPRPAPSLGGRKTQGPQSATASHLLRENQGIIEMWLPREPVMGWRSEEPEVAVPASQPLFWASAIVASCSRVISWLPGAKATVPKAGAAAGAPGERGGLGSGGHARRAAGGAGLSSFGRRTPRRPLPATDPPAPSLLSSVLRWSPWPRLRQTAGLGEILKTASLSLCVCGPVLASNRMTCPYENSCLRSQGP